MAVEHTPAGKRSFWDAYPPRIGVPVGMILATLVLFLLRGSMSPEAFLAWGWRIPFLLSVALIVVGYFIRAAVAESPVFQRMIERKRDTATPLRSLLRTNKKQVILAAVIFIGNNAAGYLVIAFLSSYGRRCLGMPTAPVLLATLLASFDWLIFTLYGGILSDRIGARADIPARLRAHRRLDDPALPADRQPQHLGLRHRHLHPGHRPGAVLRAHVRDVRGHVPRQRPLLRHRLRPASDRRRDVRRAHFGVPAHRHGWSGSISLYIMALCLISFIGITLVKETRDTPRSRKPCRSGRTVESGSWVYRLAEGCGTPRTNSHTAPCVSRRR
jgi:MFS family permease